MKKILCTIFLLSLLLVMAGCGRDISSQNIPQKSINSTQNNTTTNLNKPETESGINADVNATLDEIDNVMNGIDDDNIQMKDISGN